jgi:Na+/H+ antiporter NhaD/arsenite permease-like protein
MNAATFIFVLTYILVALGENSPRKLDRPTATLLGAVLMVATGALSRAQALDAIDFSTLALLFGLMVLLTILMESGFPTWLALKSLSRCRSPQALLSLVVFSSGFGGALMLNDTVCLLGTPLILQITTQARLPAVPFLLALATSANIGSVMTLTGNPQNMIIGQASGWTWSGFAVRLVPIGVVCLLVNWLVLSLLFRRPLAEAKASFQPQIPAFPPVQRPLALKSLMVFAGLLAAFVAGAPMDFAAVAAATALLIWANRPPREPLTRLDWPLLLFFAGLFVVVQGFTKADSYLLHGLENYIMALEARLHLAGVLEIGLAAVVGSNIFSNVPLVIVVSHWINRIAQPQFLWLLLALTSTFAGNLTLFGSAANLIVAQGARGQAPLRFRDFLKVGVPVTLATTAVGIILLWAFWRLGWV